MKTDEGKGLPPIERDEDMGRDYIPLPGGWEVQTKGNGSTFRLCDTKSGDRWPVLDHFLHDALERMAREIRAAAEPAAAQAQVSAFADVTAAWVPFSRRLEIAESVGMVVDQRFNKIVQAVVEHVVRQRDAAPPVTRDAFSSALRGLVESLNRKPLAEELRFAAHELTVMADRISARARRGEEDDA